CHRRSAKLSSVPPQFIAAFGGTDTHGQTKRGSRHSRLCSCSTAHRSRICSRTSTSSSGPQMDSMWRCPHMRIGAERIQSEVVRSLCPARKIGRASCRERVEEVWVGGGE